MRSVRILTFITSGIFLFIGAIPLLFMLSDVTAIFRPPIVGLGIAIVLCLVSGIMGIICGILLGFNEKAGRILLLVAALFSGLILSPYLLFYISARKRSVQPLVEPLYPWHGSKTWPDSF